MWLLRCSADDQSQRVKEMPEAGSGACDKKLEEQDIIYHKWKGALRSNPKNLNAKSARNPSLLLHLKSINIERTSSQCVPPKTSILNFIRAQICLIQKSCIS